MNTEVIKKTTNPQDELYHEIPSNDEEWLSRRCLGIGGSELAVLCGYLPLTLETPLGWYRKRKGIDEPVEMTDAMARGHFLEDGVAKMFARSTGYTIFDNTAGNEVYYRKSAPYMRVTPDRFGLVDKKKKNRNSVDMTKSFILEVKTHSGVISYNESTKEYNYPMQWRAQVMYGLGICGCPFGYICWLDSTLKVGYDRIDFDQHEFDNLKKVVETYWIMLENNIEPDACTSGDYAKKYPAHVIDKSIELNLEQQSKVDELKEINAQIVELNARKESIECILKDAIKDAECAVDASGVKMLSWKSSAKFSEEAFKEAETELYQRYLEPTLNTTALKKENAKLYKQYCTAPGPRVFRISK